TTVERFAAALESVDHALPPDVPFHIHFSDVSYANRNEKAHISYGQGTLRAEPLAEALARFNRPAPVIPSAQPLNGTPHRFVRVDDGRALPVTVKILLEGVRRISGDSEQKAAQA